MIDEKLLIDRLNDKKDFTMDIKILYGHAEDSMRIWYECLKKVKKFIDEQAKTAGWIPCRMGLPESEEWQIRTLLATVRYKNNTFVSTASFDCSNRKWLVDKGKEVIAWQPLPEIYTENHQD